MLQKISINFAYLLPFCIFFFQVNFAGQSDSLLEKGIQFYRNKNFQEAKNILSKYIPNFSQERTKNIALLYIAKCEIQLREYLFAEKRLQQLLYKTNGVVFEDVCLLLSELHWKKNKKNDAVQYLILLADSLYTSSRFSSVFNYICALLDNFSEGEIEELQEVPFIKKNSELFFLILGKYYYRKGITSKAEEYLLKIITGSSQSKWHSEAVSIYSKGSTEEDETDSLKKNVIAVVLPLSGSQGNKKVASEVLDGIKLALHNYNEKTKNKFYLKIFDSGRSKQIISEIATQIRKNKNVRAVIGALYSDETIFLAKELAFTDIPLIAPTATDDTLLSLNKNIIQANPSFGMRGRADAEYIFKYEGKEKIAVLYANEGYSFLSAKAFMSHYQELGGRVIFQKSFSQSRLDFGEIVKIIRQYDNDIEGIYIPLSDRNAVRTVLTEFNKANIHIPIYGNQDWLQPAVLDDFPSYAGMMVISSDYFIDFTDVEYLQLNEKFHSIKHYDINRNVLYGFDAANYLMINISRENITSYEKYRDLKGLHNDINTGKGRINTSMNFLRYQDGIFHLITRLSQD